MSARHDDAGAIAHALCLRMAARRYRKKWKDSRNGPECEPC